MQSCANKSEQYYIQTRLTRIHIDTNHHRLAKDAYAVVVISDISHQKHLERDLKRLNSDLDMRVRERTAQLEKYRMSYSRNSKNALN